jgi:hypothetical protein
MIQGVGAMDEKWQNLGRILVHTALYAYIYIGVLVLLLASFIITMFL